LRERGVTPPQKKAKLAKAPKMNNKELCGELIRDQADKKKNDFEKNRRK